MIIMDDNHDRGLILCLKNSVTRITYQLNIAQLKIMIY